MPRPQASPSPVASSGRSSVYSDDAPGHSPSYLVEPETTASQLSTSSSVDGVDSLLDASNDEVKARAEFLLNETKEASDELTVLDLPRRIPPTPEGKLAAQTAAVEFLRAKVAEAEQDDWRYASRTSAAFAPPTVLHQRGQAEQEVEQVGEWMDKTFNLESFGNETREEDEAEGAARVEMEHEGGGFGRFGDHGGAGYD